MKTLDDWLLLAAGLIIGLSMTNCEVKAQTGPSDEELLANICVHEAGWDFPGDCWGIYAVLANQAAERHITWQHYLRQGCRRFSRGLGRNAWAHLLRDTDRGPSGVLWSNERVGGLPSRRAAYHELVTLAYEILRTPVVCGATAWGNHRDYSEGPFAEHHRHDVFVTCGEGARNLYSHGP